MKIYSLTSVGRNVARSVNNPTTLPYRVVHFLDNHGAATDDQVAGNMGVSLSEAKSVLGRLKRNKPPIISEGTGSGIV